MKFFKNFQTKRQLREENERLKFMLNMPEPIRIIERDVQKLCCSILIEQEVPTEYIKKEVIYRFCEQLEPFVEWDIEDYEKYPTKRRLKGSIYIAIRATNNQTI